ncbi:MAG: barstar family protein [Oscillospiraceae bacterium]|nr:barstar family protein [Oscillospiraceae bacterium]
MVIELKGSLMTDRAAIHDCLQAQLQLPHYYGRNLDALFDLLTERTEATEIMVTEWEELEVHLGGYAAALMDTLYDAAKENPALKIQVK